MKGKGLLSTWLNLEQSFPIMETNKGVSRAGNAMFLIIQICSISRPKFQAGQAHAKIGLH